MMGINPRDMQKAMKRLGIQQQEIDAKEVIIRCADRDIIITNPSVAKVNMMGQETYQITGNAEEKEREITINEDDIKTVMEQTGKNKEDCIKAIKDNNGDLATAIITLKS